MENRSPRLPNAGKRVLPGKPLVNRGHTLAIRQQLWERAQRLYAIGEMNLAAQLLSELDACRHPRPAEAGGKAVNG
ncbi:MAG: hypothetical protein WBL61_06040 [Bryobacteraceae bacterium]